MKDEQTCSDLLGLRCIVVDLKSTKSCWMTIQYLTSRFPSILNKVRASTCQFVKLDDPEREREDLDYFDLIFLYQNTGSLCKLQKSLDLYHCGR